MVGIRKASRPTKHEDFRRRLERALSLSPSDSDSAQGSLSSAESDTTEIESLEENNIPRLQRETNLVDTIPQDATEDWIQREDSSLSTLADKTGIICSDLDDIAQQLVAVEAATEAINSETQSTTEEKD
ncbi:hypothetical protein N7513_003645 [Penicillium frequentans]|nr:hypothetical protein N7513_003645 [Penicillium glabrum]